jgi:hypothetical protein
MFCVDRFKGWRVNSSRYRPNADVCSHYERELMNEGDNPPIGIILCADKNDLVVKYTLPEGDKSIYVSKYKLYLPSEEELIEELNREYGLLSMDTEK